MWGWSNDMILPALEVTGIAWSSYLFIYLANKQARSQKIRHTPLAWSQLILLFNCILSSVWNETKLLKWWGAYNETVHKWQHPWFLCFMLFFWHNHGDWPMVWLHGQLHLAWQGLKYAMVVAMSEHFMGPRWWHRPKRIKSQPRPTVERWL